jgi:hypothetical protein
MVHGEINPGRDVLVEDKYKDLGAAFISAGFQTKGVIYNDEISENLYVDLLAFDAILVWVNPIEQGSDRKTLDSLLSKLAENGCLVSAHPETILKMGRQTLLFHGKLWAVPGFENANGKCLGSSITRKPVHHPGYVAGNLGCGFFYK